MALSDEEFREIEERVGMLTTKYEAATEEEMARLIGQIIDARKDLLALLAEVRRLRGES